MSSLKSHMSSSFPLVQEKVGDCLGDVSTKDSLKARVNQSLPFLSVWVLLSRGIHRSCYWVLLVLKHGVNT